MPNNHTTNQKFSLGSMFVLLYAQTLEQEVAALGKGATTHPDAALFFEALPPTLHSTLQTIRAATMYVLRVRAGLVHPEVGDPAIVQTREQTAMSLSKKLMDQINKDEATYAYVAQHLPSVVDTLKFMKQLTGRAPL